MRWRPPPSSARARLIAVVGVVVAGLAVSALLASHARFSAQTTTGNAGGMLPLFDVDWRSEEGSAVFYFLSRGIINGFSGTFRGQEPVSRAEAAKILLQAGG